MSAMSVNKSLYDIAEALEQVVISARDIIGCDETSVILWNRRTQNFELSASTNIDDSLTKRVRREGGATRWIIDTQETMLINDMDDNSFTNNSLAVEANIQAFIGVPICYQEHRLGVMYALSQSDFRFTQDHVKDLQALANTTAYALYNAQLVVELQELNDFKDAMMGLAAHDLRNPLSRVVGYFGMMMEDLSPLDEMHAPWAEEIHRSLNQVHDLIDGIMDYERIEQMSDKSSFKVSDLNQVVKTIYDRFHKDAVEADKPLTLNLSETTLPVWMDTILIEECLGNIVSNAIKYADPDKPITIESAIEADTVLVKVIDQGPGIAEQDQEKVFQPFSRLRAAKHQRGSGLGLSLVKIIVERHYGSISLESEVGIGSTFIIELPLEQ